MDNEIIKSMDDTIRLIKKYQNIYLVSHIQPDGDSIGSVLALGRAIKKLKKNSKQVKIIKVDDLPNDYQFLPDFNEIKECIDNGEIDILIALDSTDLSRIGRGKAFAKKAKKVINIDHHITNENFGDINIVSPSSAATGEIVYELINRMGLDIDKKMATCLYTAITTDTGSFMYSNTTKKTHMIVADLFDSGINIGEININIFQSRSLVRTKLFIEAMSNLETFLDNRIGLVSVTQKMLYDKGASMEDTEGLASYIKEIDSIELACLLKEVKKKEIKVSLRSKRQIDVARICKKLNGGGHVRAAGCTIYEKLEDAKEIILDEIIKSFG